MKRAHQLASALAAIVAGTIACAGGDARAFDTSTLGQGGSLLLEDIMPLVATAPALAREVATEAGKIGKTPAEIVCGGMRFGSEWSHLGGYRVSPYVCGFGEERFLEIRAAVSLMAASGKEFKAATADARKNARRIRETKPAWTWMTEDPRLKRRQ